MSEEKFLVSVRDLEQRLADSETRIVDCRFDLMQPDKGFQDYRSGHIPGAVYAHLDRDLAAPRTPNTGRHPLPQPHAFAGTLGRWGIGNDTRVVVYDEGGGAIAARLWWLLRWVGHTRVGLLDGGFAAWRRAGHALSTAPARIAPREYAVHPDAGMVVTTQELLQSLDAGSAPLIFDARAAARFRGETEPIDPVAGHIPGARSLPFDRSLRSDGAWRDRAALVALWHEALGGNSEASWVAMCGSGVTACHLALSACQAGFGPPRLYAGSFSEWIRDPARPVATGPADDAGQG